MAIRISRSTQVPATFAGRAASPTMRLSGASLSMDQQAIQAEGEVTKLAFNTGTAVASGLAAGFSGQTTEDLGSIAAQGKDARDVNNFEVGKFMEQTVTSLGGVGGLLDGVEKQNVAANMVTDYQKGVKIGEAHVKQQSEDYITIAIATADANFKQDMARGNYTGAVDRAWKSHQDSLTQKMNDPNTTPAVRTKIQAYINNPLAKAKFDSKYIAKEANAIAQRTAKKAEGQANALIDAGNVAGLEMTMKSQMANGERMYTEEEYDNNIHKAKLKSFELNALDPSKTPKELSDFQKEVKNRSDLSNAEKSRIIQQAETQSGRNKEIKIRELKQNINNKDIDSFLKTAKEEGVFDTTKEMNDFKAKYVSETAVPITKLMPKLQSALAEIRMLPSMHEKELAFQQLKNSGITTGSKAQDAVMDSVFSDFQKELNEADKASSSAAQSLFDGFKEQYDEVLGDITVEEKGGGLFGWFDRTLKEEDVPVKLRRIQASKDMSDIQTRTNQLMRDGKNIEAVDYYNKATADWTALYMDDVYAKDVLSSSQAKQDKAVRFTGTEQEIEDVEQKEIEREQQRVQAAADLRAKIAQQEKIQEQEKQTDIRIREAGIRRRPAGDVKLDPAFFQSLPFNRTQGE